MKFKPSDFEWIAIKYSGDDALRLVDECNAKLEEFLKEAPVVYGLTNPLEGEMKFVHERRPMSTHKAKLVQIEEL